MTRIIEVPGTLDQGGFDAMVAQAAEVEEGGGAIVDASRVRFANPFGMVGLLAIGAHLGQRGKRPQLRLPTSSEVGSYLTRMRFHEEARRLYEVSGGTERSRGGGETNVLLEITPIGSHEDVHDVIDRVQDRAGTILKEKLGYPVTASTHFSMMLSEVCQNIIEHAEADGWVGIQSYKWKKTLGREVVVIAVMDLGVGFRGSLEREHAAHHGDRWSDATALEAAFLHGTTRFRDPGRGQGIKQIRARVHRWGGKISIRSGTARITDVPEWDDAPPLQTELARFPGSQIQIVLPAVAPLDDAAGS